MDTSTGEVDMTRNKNIMNVSDKLIGKVDLMEASKSYGVDNSLNKGRINLSKKLKHNNYTNYSGKLKWNA
jgi:hypothetical protein